MSQKVITVDVRDDLARGHEPFSKIMESVARLQAHEDLLVIAPFEPAPLYAVLGKQGFSHRANLTPSGAWEVWFHRGDEPVGLGGSPVLPGQPAAVGAGEPRDPMAVVEVDARGLEPPEPLVRILEALATLPAGARLQARTDRRPIHLHTQAEERGFVARSEEQKDGSFITNISRA